MFAVNQQLVGHTSGKERNLCSLLYLRGRVSKATDVN